jgi:serine-type D-Ala-D-Ala carboxypeptidase/endopeptidase (penicillin-binding protein 4)
VYRHLTQSGVFINGKYFTHRDTFIEKKDPRLLKTWESPLLDKIIAYANSESNNLICEALIYQLGSKLKSGKFKYDGSTAITEWLYNLGLKDSLFFVEDGSGLSLKNGYTPANFGLFLYNFKSKKYFLEWQNSLPVAGKNGTVRNFLPDRSVKSLVRVKSGSLSRVRCYAGYIKTSSGKELSFVMMANQFVCSSREVRQKMELLLTELTKL